MLDATPARKYSVFISYKHADNQEMGRKWASWLHEMLESYEAPAELIGKTNERGDPIPASLYPVFRDEKELPATSNLSARICHALENTPLLVVICSPRSVQSTFVTDEIRYFKKLGKGSHILPFIIEGQPYATNVEDECYPRLLRYGVLDADGEVDETLQCPLALGADVRLKGGREQGWTTSAAYQEHLELKKELGKERIAQAVLEYADRLNDAKLKIIAGALAYPLGELTQRDKVYQLAKARQQTKTLRRWLVVVGALALVAMAIGYFALQQKHEAVRERESAHTALAQSFSRTIGQNPDGFSLIENDALWELAELTETNEAVRTKIGQKWLALPDGPLPALMRDQAGLRALVGIKAMRLDWNSLADGIVSILENKEGKNIDSMLEGETFFPTLVARLDDRKAISLAERLVDIMEDHAKTNSSLPLSQIETALNELTPRFDAQSAAPFAERVIKLLEHENVSKKERLFFSALNKVLEVLVPTLDLGTRPALAGRVIKVLENERKADPECRAYAAPLLEALAPSLDGKGATSLAERVLKLLADEQMSDSFGLFNLASVLKALAPSLDANATASLADRLMTVLENQNENSIDENKASRLKESLL